MAEFTYYAGIRLMKNGGTGHMDEIIGQITSSSSSATVTLTAPKCEFTKNEYKFLEWNTEPDGTGTAYPVQSAIPVITNKQDELEPKMLNLYAQWAYSAQAIRLKDTTGREFDFTGVSKITVPTADGQTITFSNLGIVPTGDYMITTAGAHDVSEYATATILDLNLKPENIRKGIQILGITGSYTGEDK